MIRHRKCCITDDDLTRVVRQLDFGPLRERIEDLGLTSPGDPAVDMLQENMEADISNFYHAYNPEHIEIFVASFLEECYLSCILGPNFLITNILDCVLEFPYPQYSPFFAVCNCDIHQNALSCSLSECFLLQWVVYRERALTNNSNY